MDEFAVNRDAKRLFKSQDVFVGHRLTGSAHREHFDFDFRGFFDRIHHAEDGIKIFSGAEDAMVGPNRDVVLLHQIGGRGSDFLSAANHPGQHANASWENDRAFGHRGPKGLGEGFVSQGEDEGQGDDVRGVAVIDNAIFTVGAFFDDFEVH